MNAIDTIAAIATPIGSAGIGIIRISGPDALTTAARVFSADPAGLPSHTATYGALIRRDIAEEIDRVVLTVFRSPRSYTGEDVAEFSCHGGMATMKAALQAVLDAGARLAEPGEFTQRAFLNGKLDLAQAEAVNDLIRSRTDAARKVALRQLDGALSEKIRTLRDQGLGVIAAIEAAIDFPDDVPEPDTAELKERITRAYENLLVLLKTFEKGRIYREGLRVAIVGRVNVGKSSLLNALLRHARAIVTPIPGTTRDLIEESLEIHGIPIVAIDTAGLRQTDDPVEKIGVALTHKSIDDADVMVFVVDASQKSLHDDDRRLFDMLAEKPFICALNKSDLVSVSELEALAQTLPYEAIRVSAKYGGGIEELEAAIARRAGVSGEESSLVSSARHKEALKSASESLRHALEGLDATEPIDLISIDLTAAYDSLGLITGETASDDLLDRIFSEFCIGK